MVDLSNYNAKQLKELIKNYNLHQHCKGLSTMKRSQLEAVINFFLKFENKQFTYKDNVDTEKLGEVIKKAKNQKPIKKEKLKIYCGTEQPPPSGHRYGTMKECVDLKQVRLYGLRKVDRRLLESTNTKKESDSELTVKLLGLRGKLTKLKRDFDASESQKDKLKIMKEYDEVRKELLLLNEKKQKESMKKQKPRPEDYEETEEEDDEDDEEDDESNVNDVLKDVNETINTSNYYLFKNNKILLNESSGAKLKKSIKENISEPKANIKVYIFNFDVDVKSKTPLKIIIGQYTLTPKLSMTSKDDDKVHTITFTEDELKKYKFKVGYIGDIVKAFKTKKLYSGKSSISISDVLKK